MVLVVESRWLRTVAPATACLRLGVVLSILGARAIGLELQPLVIAVAVGAALLYAATYLALWTGHLRSAVLAYMALVDAFLLGLLLSGAGSFTAVVAFLALPVLTTAQMTAGLPLALFAAISLGAGWCIGWLMGMEALIWATHRAAATFGTTLEVETHYHRVSALTPPALPAPAVALAMLFLISLAGAIAWARAVQERRRVSQMYTQAEALETIVDSVAIQASTDEFWQIVLRSGAAISGARVYVGSVEGGIVKLRAGRGPVTGNELDQTVEWILRSLRVPLSEERNVLVQSIRRGTEEDFRDIAALCVGSERSVAPEILEKLQSSWSAMFVCVPIGAPEAVAALLGVAPQMTDSVRQGLRLVAERTSLALRARQELDGEPLAQMPAGSKA